MSRVAVVGAGVAGLGAAYALREGCEVTVFERSARVGGRAATRRRHGCVYDVGANYVKSDDERVSRLVRDELPSGLVEVDGPVWTFDADGDVSPGRGEDEPKWTYRNGIEALGERLLDASGAALSAESRVTSLRRAEDWHVTTESGGERGPWDALVLTPPAPVTASLLDLAEWDDDLRPTLREEVGHVPYRPILTVALHYPFELDRPYYGLVNTDDGHDIGWLAREGCKPGHVPEGESLLVVQMAPGWSADRYDRDGSTVAATVADRVADLLDDRSLAAPDWFDVVRWRDALPNAGADRDLLARAEREDLHFAGDWVVGEGRVHRALGNGLVAGERVDARRSDSG